MDSALRYGFLLVLGCVGFAVINASDAAKVGASKSFCNETQLSSCLATYFAKAGLQGPFPSGAAFANALSGAILAKKSNYFKICQADRYLADCLGFAQYKYCLSGVELIRTGVDPQSAFVYQEVVAQSRFLCGAGYFTFLRQYDCWKLQLMKYSKTLTACSSFYHSRAAADPAKLCTYLPAYAECFQQVGNQCNAELGWSMCEDARLGVVNFSGDQCSYRCTVTPQASEGKPAGEAWPETLMESGLLESPIPNFSGLKNNNNDA